MRRSCIRKSTTRATWVDRWGVNHIIVTVTFNEANGITNVATTIKFASKADRDAAFSTGMTDGMEMNYKQLDGVLAGEVALQLAHAPSLAFDRTANTV